MLQHFAADVPGSTTSSTSYIAEMQDDEDRELLEIAEKMELEFGGAKITGHEITMPKVNIGSILITF